MGSFAKIRVLLGGYFSACAIMCCSLQDLGVSEHVSTSASEILLLASN
jgi:hypothetical protein